MLPSNFESNRERLIDAFHQRLLGNDRFKTITQARSFAAEVLGAPVVAGQPLAKAVEEAIEQAIVLTAKKLIEQEKEKSALQTYDKLVDLYKRQPTLGTRTSTSIEMQAFSTPVPLAFLAGKLADISADTSVYEPSAGRGALVMLCDPANTFVNELDPNRAADLMAQGYQATQQDATQHLPPASVDRVIANPPFGRRKKDGHTERFHIGCTDTPGVTSELDQAITWKALEAMKDDGKAVLIMGSELGNEALREQKYSSVRCQRFFFNLYRQYNVKEHFTIDGKLYSRQGAAFPVDVIVIEGRKLSPFLSPKTERKLPAADVPKVYSSYTELRSLFVEKGIAHEQETDSDLSNQSSSLGTMGTGRGDKPSRSLSTGEDGSNRNRRPLPGSPENEASGDGRRLQSDDRSSESAVGRDDSQALLELYQRRDISALPRRRRHSQNSRGKSPPKNEDKRSLSSTSRNRSHQESRSDRDSRAQHDARRMDDSPDPIAPFQNMSTPDESARQNDKNNQLGQVSYQPRSQGKTLDSYVPQNLEVPIQTALDNLENAVGDVDQFVTDTLNFGSVENLHQALAAEQVDGVALAIRNLQQGKAALIGDDTGLGKGRQMAAAIKYSLETGNIPIFVTKEPGLYADMARDLADIGLDASQIRPFMTNSKQTIPLPDGRTLETKPASHERELNQMMLSGELSSQYNMIFSTYSQLQTVKGEDTNRRQFLDQIAAQSILILDEAHEAGGSSNDVNKTIPDRAAFTRNLVSQAQGVFFASATATKRPDVMDLYAMRMNVADITSVRGLQSTLEQGGTPLQQVSTAMLALDGQYTRRARTYNGVEVSSQVVDTNHDDADQLSEIMREILQFDKDKQEAVSAIDQEAKALGKRVGTDSSTGMAGAQSTSFSSMIWLVTEQAALSRKADAVADYAISVLEQGEKPFIGLGSTMGSFLEEYVKNEGLRPGEQIHATFQDVLARYLERSRDVLIKDYSGMPTRERLTDDELGEKATAQYNKVEKLIDQADFSQMPTSPIDWVRHRVEAAGHSFGELTGRTAYIEYNKDGTATYQTKSSAETSKAAKIEIIDGFNNGSIDVGIGNRSASTGYSMHTSTKFKDQRRRHFIIAQPERDINVFKQFMGRFHRTGQVNAPKISLVVGNTPDETRPAAILAKKLASLKANTTAARQNGIDFSDIPDYLNDIGDQVVSDMIRFDPDLSEQLFDPITVSETSTRPVEGAAAKVTGALPILPVVEQEAFYAQLSTEYKATLERYTAMGENPLEANSVDLDARTLGNVDVVSRKEESTSVFAEGISAEIVDVKVQSKPKSQLEVVNDIRQTVGLPIIRTLEEHSRKEVDRLSVAAVESLYEKAIIASEKHKQSKQQEYEAKEPDLEKRLGKLDKLDVSSKKQLQALTQLRRFRPGQTVRVVAGNDRVFYGAITAVRKRGQSLDKLISQENIKENPTIPSRWEIVIAIADAQRQITLPLSKMNTGSRQADSYTMSLAQHSLVDGDIYEMFDKRQTADREVRILMKGNLLRLGETAYADQGDLIVATMSNGKAEPVLFMKPEFNLEEEMQTTPVVLPNASAVRQFLQETDNCGVIKTLDNSIVLKRDSVDTFLMQTGKRRKDVFLDKGLLAATGSEFTSIGDRMECQFPNEQLTPVLDHLRQYKGQSIAAFSDHQLARDMLGVKLPEIRLTDTVQETISREGLAPSVDMSNMEAVRQQLAKNFASEPAAPKTVDVPQPDESQVAPGATTEGSSTDTAKNEDVIMPASSEAGEAQQGKEDQQETEAGDPATTSSQSTTNQADQTESLSAGNPDLPAKINPTPATPESTAKFELQRSAQHRLLCEKRVVRFLHESTIAPQLTGEGDFHLRIENDPWMPLVIEAHDMGDHKNVYLTHYREQNSDLIHDGEMVFKLREDGHLSFEETAVQNFRGGEIRNYDKSFAAMFSMNVLEQGFAEAAKEQLTGAQQVSQPEIAESDHLAASDKSQQSGHLLDSNTSAKLPVVAAGDASNQAVEDKTHTAQDQTDSLSVQADPSTEDLAFVEQLVTDHEGDENAIIDAILDDDMELPSEPFDSKIDESITDDDQDTELPAQLEPEQTGQADVVSQVEAESLLEDNISNSQLDELPHALSSTSESDPGITGSEGSTPKPYLVVSDAYAEPPIEISPVSATSEEFEDSAQLLHGVVSNPHTAPITASPIPQRVLHEKNAASSLEVPAVLEGTPPSPDKTDQYRTESQPQSTHPPQLRETSQNQPKRPTQSTSQPVESPSSRQTLLAKVSRFFRSALHAAAAPSEVEKRQHRRDADARRPNEINQPAPEASAYDAPQAVVSKNSTGIVQETELAAITSQNTNGKEADPVIPSVKSSYLSTTPAQDGEQTTANLQRSLFDAAQPEVVDHMSTEEYQPSKTHQTSRPPSIADTTQAPAIVTITATDLAKAIKASIYIEDGKTFSELEKLLDNQTNQTEVAISATLKNRAIANRLTASQKFRHVLAEDIVPMAQKLLHTAERAGLTTTRGNTIAFEGKNYTVTSQKADATQTVEIRCHRSNGHIFAIDGKIERADNIVLKDKDVFSKFSSKTPLQLQHAICKRQKAKSSGVSH